MCKKCRGGWNYPLEHRDFTQGGVDASDFDETPAYRSVKRSRRKGRKRVCAKSKTDEVCTADVWVEQYRYWSKTKERWIVSGAMACARCGRHVTWQWGLTSRR